MRKLSIAAIVAAGMAVGTVWHGAAHADGVIKVGVLTCNEAGGWGFVFGSSHEINCGYSPRPGVVARYVGHIAKFGVDVGYLSNAVVMWGVFAPSADLGPGALAGDYGGVSADASVGAGLGANALVGGSTRSIALQPLSIEGSTGLNVAAGIAELHLVYKN